MTRSTNRRRSHHPSRVVALLLVIVGAVGGLGALHGTGGSGAGGSAAGRMSRERLDRLSLPTWPPNTATLPGVERADALPPVGGETHYHVHLTLYVDGHRTVIPALVGFDPATQAFAPIHTHLTNGVIHIEAAVAGFRATLGEAFDVWGVRFDDGGIGGDDGPVSVWVDGKRYRGDPRALVLRNHQALTVVEGRPPRGFAADRSFLFDRRALAE
jgi:hypothetical protein